MGTDLGRMAQDCCGGGGGGWVQTPRPVLAPGGAPTMELGCFPITDVDVRIGLTCHILVVDLKHGIFQ